MIERYLESTNLKTNARWKDIRNLVKEANETNCVAVCTYLNWCSVVSQYAKPELKKVYVVGFYTGSKPLIERDLFYIKRSGGDEFDLVFPLALFTVGSIDEVKNTIKKVRKETDGKILKVIIETNILRDLPESEDKIKEVIQISKECGADFIKTNTGKYNRRIPIEEDIKLIKKFTRLSIKAAGGIGTYKLADDLVKLGVKRLGTSNARKIIEEERLCDKT